DSSVVLPEPDGPVSATNSPGSSVRDTSSSATTSGGWRRPTRSTATRAPRASPASAEDTDAPVEVLAPLPADRHGDAERERVADRARGPQDRVAVAAAERVRSLPALAVAGVGVLRRDDLDVVED